MDANILQNAVEALRLRGKVVDPADMPGLYNVDGRELTTGQVIDYARQLREQS